MSAVMHRYYDCPIRAAGDEVHWDDDDERPVTCAVCRRNLGLDDAETDQ